MAIHRWLCRSARWQRMLEQTVLPWALNEVEMGQDVLEVGPGPSLTMDLSRIRQPARLILCSQLLWRRACVAPT
jgi:hypothetical protein